jgi:putative endonuclease
MASTRLHPPGLPPSVSPGSVEVGAPGWGVYILRCADGTLYTGCTNDLERRLLSHARRQVKYTRSRLPIALAYWEPIGQGAGAGTGTGPGTGASIGQAGRSAALRREAAIKRLPRRTKLALCGHVKLC